MAKKNGGKKPARGQPKKQSKSGGKQRSAKIRATIAQRRATILVNVKSGLGYRAIADGLGISIGTVSSDMTAVLDEWRADAICSMADVVSIEQMRIDSMVNAIWDKCIGGDLLAIDRMVKLMERRAKLLGYDKMDEDSAAYLRILATHSDAELIAHGKAITGGSDRARSAKRKASK